MAKRTSSGLPPVADVLRKLHACHAAIRWSERYNNDWAKAWRECERLDWLYHIPISTTVPVSRSWRAMCDADEAGIDEAQGAPDYNYDNGGETGGPRSCAAYRKHVKWGKHIKPVLREMGWL